MTTTEETRHLSGRRPPQFGPPDPSRPEPNSDPLARQLRQVKMLLAGVLVAIVVVGGGAWFVSRPDPGPSDQDCMTLAVRLDAGMGNPGDRERFARCFD